MRLCATCARHVRDHEGRCPFCKTRLAVVTGLAGAALVAGCQASQPVSIYAPAPPPSASPSAEAPPGADARPMQPVEPDAG